MPAISRRMHYSYAEYLSLEEESQIRHEYLDGEIYAMAGGTPDHAALAAAVLQIIGSQLPRGCRAFTSDLRLRIPSTGLSTFPDGAVVCGGSQRAADDPMAVTNPMIVVEVTSNSSEDYDRDDKLRHYQTIPTLREVLIVSHRAPRITVHRVVETRIDRRSHCRRRRLSRRSRGRALTTRTPPARSSTR